MIVRLFRDPLQGGTGQPTLTDLTDPEYNPPAPDPAAPVEGLNADGTVQDGYEKQADGTVVKKTTDDPPSPIEGLDTEGNLLEGYEKLADGTVQKIAITDGTVTEEDEEDSVAFWETVSAITGESYDIEYGDTDPISPEGVAIRERHVREKGAQDFEEALKQRFPKAYSYMLHLDAGLPDEEFFQKTTPTLPTRAEFESNADMHAQVVLNDLVNKGVDHDIAQAQVDKAVKDNTLKLKAMKIYDDTDKVQRKQLEEMEAFSKRQQAEFDKSVDTLLKQVDTTMASDSMAFIIPEKKLPEFKQFIQDRIRWAENKFFFSQEIDATNLPKLMEQLLFSFNGGNLKGLVERQAKTLTSQRLRTTAARDKRVQNSGAPVTSTTPKHIPLGDL